MNIFDLFTFKEKFIKKSRTYQLSFNVPEATAFGLYFEGAPFSQVEEGADQVLLELFDDLFESADFIGLFEQPLDLFDEILVAYESYRKGQKPSELLGTWDYSRSKRQISLVWKVPDWFEGHEQFGAGDPQELGDFCKDWYFSFEMTI